MDDMAAYYPPPPAAHHQNPHYPYHQPPPPLPPPYAAAQPPPSAVPHPQPHHLSQQFHPHYQPPPLSSYAPPAYKQSSHDEVRTLFVAGLPEDVKPREIFNLFREFPGYESSHLRTPSPNSQPFAFVVFMDQHSAIGALQALNGMVFDLEKGSTLYIDLAKSNSRSKRSRTDDERPGFEKRAKGSAAFSWGNLDSGVGSIHMPGIGNTAHDTVGYPSTQSHANFDRTGNDSNAAKFSNPSGHHAPRNAPPCPTLFVANLGPACSEQELNQVFSSCSGFLKLKMQGTYGAPVAFVDFKDTASSSEALSRLQGTVLYSSPPGEGMRLEYAKSRMGMRSKKSR